MGRRRSIEKTKKGYVPFDGVDPSIKALLEGNEDNDK